MNLKKTFYPALLASTLSACAPTTEATRGDCFSEVSYLPFAGVKESRYERQKRIHQLLADTINEGKFNDELAYSTCTNAHQECIARTSLRWNRFTTTDDIAEACPGQTAFLTNSLKHSSTTDCFFTELEKGADQHLLISYLYDANACTTSVANCMENLSKISNHKEAIDAAIKKAVDGDPLPEFVAIGEVLGHDVEQYVKGAICKPNQTIRQCQETTDAITGQFYETHSSEIEACYDQAKKLGVPRDCHNETLKAHPQDYQTTINQEEQCRKLTTQCLTAALIEVME